MTYGWEKMWKIQNDFLDTLPIKKIYEETGCPKLVGDLIQSIRRYVWNNKVEMPEELDGYPTNWMTEYDFCEYLHNRYPAFGFQEKTTYSIWFAEN